MDTQETFAAKGAFASVMPRFDPAGLESRTSGRAGYLAEQMRRMNERIDRLAERMEHMEKCMARMEHMAAHMERIEHMEKCMEHMKERMECMEKRTDRLELRYDAMEESGSMEFQAVRTEMEVVYKTLFQQIDMVNGKADRILFTKDIHEYDRLKARVEALELGFGRRCDML